ncbi:MULTISPECIES: Stealth CR1 domain-containing protein [unclassified Streptococcus]|uniref:Stealth CR1 domain-containing protein n=1 Tax=unclassified Streptococcus TaxID=2608887 RepID=UPI001071DD20|nr:MULTISPECIES: Stealth CR1 domain-containing protein [unclassified Streptococcus]MBF0806144.1 Stealth CR1 domain-containing protein [Streptococcus sp. 19428wA2_WM07]TFU28256.1 capsular biosynthesis protein [Streptococcus sp. WM07]
MTQEKIDFVVTWVDGSDPVWLERKKACLQEKFGIELDSSKEDGEERYRDFGLFQYWFRSIEKYAPWVNKIFLVTDRQKPDWLDVTHPKIRWVNHEEFIPHEYLPTYSSPAIELNFHRIEDLSENFVYFNDDVYLVNPVEPEDFFVRGLPKHVAIYDAIVPWHPFIKTLYNNMEVLYRHFPNKTALRNSPLKFFNLKYGLMGNLKNMLLLPWKPTGYVELHVANSIRKSTIAKLWDLELETIKKTVESPLRDYSTGINQYLFRYWDIESNQFEPQSLTIGKRIDMNQTEEFAALLKSSRYKMVCINDTLEFNTENQIRLQELFEQAFPVKSDFEL